jgi:hypothetical protein
MRLYQEFRNELHEPLDVLGAFDGMRRLASEWFGDEAEGCGPCCA